MVSSLWDQAPTGREKTAGGTRKDRCILWQTEGSLPKTTARPKTKAGQKNAQKRPTPKRREWPIMPLTVGGVFTVIFVALIVAYYIASRGPGGVNGQPVANIKCDSGEQLAVHYHAHLTIMYRGTPVSIPANTGILSSQNCFYWMHTHTTSGIIHIEAPKDSANRGFTVGDFFQIWNQPLSKKKVATFSVGKGDVLKMWVDGKPYTGDPTKIVLKSHTQVVIEIGPPFTDPPPTFDWTSPDATSEAGTSG